MLSNCLLIHNNNSKLKNKISNKIEFTYNNEDGIDLDYYITNTILPKINKETFDIIIINANLSQNSIDCYGLILLMHIRMSISLQGKRFVPILVESYLPLDVFLKLHPFSNVFSTSGTYLFLGDNIEAKLSEINGHIKLTDANFKELFLEKVNIKLPKDYLSEHSISNEWSIFKWSSIIKIKDESIEKIIQNTESMLYFKYLKNKFELEKTVLDEDFSFEITDNAKVLYIDDECHKGWHNIFEHLFTNLEYESIGSDFKNKTPEEILKIAKEKIESFQPVIVILDLRLSDSDFEDICPENLTGAKILSEIKSYNPGIQCIMFTATSRSIYLNYLNKQGIVGYIKKEAPSDKIISTFDNINNLKELMEISIKNKYLVGIYSEINEMKVKLSGQLTEIDNLLKQELSIHVSFIFDILNSQKENKLNYALLTIVKCLEIIKDSLTHERGNDVYLNHQSIPSSTQCPHTSKTSTKNKLFIILVDKLNYQTISSEALEVIRIVDTRNNYIHPNSPGSYINPTEQDIINWVKLLKVFINGIN